MNIKHLLPLIFLNCLVWVFLIPLWHFPDEQAHFGQVAFFAEKGRMPEGEEKDLTGEILISEEFLGTKRDKNGNNKYTFHPEYRIDFTNNMSGLYEKEISRLRKLMDMREMTFREATRYPSIYYVPASMIYKLHNFSDLFTRVFFVRLYSIFLFIMNIILIYKMGKILFQKNIFLVISFSLLVSFQPMFVFANSGVNSDALGNLLFTVYLYLTLRLFRNGFWKLKCRKCHSEFISESRNNVETLNQVQGDSKNVETLNQVQGDRRYGIIPIIQLLSVVILCVYTKPQFIITVPLVIISLLFVFIRDFRGKYKKTIVSLLSIVSLLVFLAFFNSRQGVLSILGNKFDFPSFIKFTIEYTIPHTWKEVLPWYFGIYDWLGVTYPRIVHRIINRVVIVSLLGLGIGVARNVIVRSPVIGGKTRQSRVLLYAGDCFSASRRIAMTINHGVIFLIFAQIFYFLGISYYDWLSWQRSGFQLGVQGRYFFPFISLHMYLILAGWRNLFPDYKNLKNIMTKILVTGMIALNFYALILIFNTYYPSFSINHLSLTINHLSQYKPWFLKGNSVILLFVAHFGFTGILLWKYLRGLMWKNEKLQISNNKGNINY